MTEQLDWTYHDRTNARLATYKGLRIRAVQDQHAENPFEGWDCNWPVIVRSPDTFRGFTSYDIDGKSELTKIAFPHEFNDAQIVHDQFAIAEALGYSGPRRIEQLMECYSCDEPTIYCRDAEVLRDAFEQALNDCSESEMLGVCAELITIAGVPCLCGTTKGYNQGDWAEVLVIASPEAQRKFGNAAPPEPKDLQATIDLYGAWAWGDVYGYIVERVETDEDGDEVGTADLDSCWGYYGCDMGTNGLEEAAMSAVDHIVETARQRRIDALKTCLRNRVPLDKRAAILTKAEETTDAVSECA